MGGGSSLSTEQRRSRAYRALRSHPNFEFPDPPTISADTKAAVIFAIEAVARYLSPPKVPGENVSFTCLQVADSVRHELLNEILEKLKVK